MEEATHEEHARKMMRHAKRWRRSEMGALQDGVRTRLPNQAMATSDRTDRSTRGESHRKTAPIARDHK